MAYIITEPCIDLKDGAQRAHRRQASGVSRMSSSRSRPVGVTQRSHFFIR